MADTLFTLEELKGKIDELSTGLASALNELNFLDIIKTTKTCTVGTPAGLQETFNSLNVYESFIYNNATQITTWTPIPSSTPIVRGDYILKGKNNAAYRIPGPSTNTYIPTMIDTTVTWALSGSPGTADLKGVSNTNGNTAQYVKKTNMVIEQPITLLVASPVVTFYNVNGEEICLSAIPYVVTKPSTTYTLTWGDGTNAPLVPTIISYAVVR